MKNYYLLNYYSSHVENFVSEIALNQKIQSTDVVGINCFGELLLKSEFRSYAEKNFSQGIQWGKIFYSKRLNLYFHETDYVRRIVKYLNDGRELNIVNDHESKTHVKSFQIEDREVLRIFRCQDKKGIITLFSFFKDNPVIESVFKAESSSKFILSEDRGDETAVIGFEG